MGAERLDRREIAGKFGFGQGRVDLGMADRVQHYRLAALATLQAWHKVMPALRDIGRNRAPAQRADRIAPVRMQRASPLSPRGFLARGCVQ